MISMKELNPKGYDMDDTVRVNLEDLHAKINAIRTAYGKPMTVTSGLRSQADQARINPSAPKSKHLTGQACDILDKDGGLWRWILCNMNLMEATGFWFEDKAATPSWVHFQTAPPKSGKRVFKP